MSSEEPVPVSAGPARKTHGGNAAYHNFHNDFVHIQDPNERRRLALAEIDKAPFGWYHVRAIVVAGVGFFTDSYDIFVASLLTTMLGIVYYPGEGKMPTTSDTAIKLATSAGTVIGQLGFGALADIVGRKRMYGLELIVIIFATLAQALSSGSPSMDVIGVIIFWRVVMGVGIGGDYPLSSIITSEFATTKWRGAMMGSVFAMQGLGQLCAAFVMLFVTLGFKGSLETSTKLANCTGVCAIAVDKMWRTLIGFGAVPGCIALYYRLTIPETPRYTFDVRRDVEKADADAKAYISGKHGEAQTDDLARIAAQKNATEQMRVPKASFGDFMRHYRIPKNGMLLAGTALSWCFLDIAYYGLSLNNATILQAIGYSTSGAKNTYEILYNTAVGNLIIVLAGAVPGYWVTVATVDTIGRKPIQLAGFAILTILFIVMGFAYWHLSPNALLAVYVLAQFFFNFGPNSTTFIVPGECFPTRYRSTSHGISAASGKIGSIIGQGAIAPLRTRGAVKGGNANPWLDHVLEIYALFMLLGCFSTLLIKETKRKTLEELSGDDDYAAGEAPIAIDNGSGESGVVEKRGPDSV
ncbi:putative inorganic phosphate transporter pho84 protein [Phaeoacremonium minimum UCRPA7]|uniref:Putative inorganic phosphate transporter pho84 protein n=1 Tax=Phaeoacremonium minimum (strain UCR-PA7) TaxID=1286976 RepID=R8BXA4_PHAM7|nr:putative inorganic phosphate transporter pho84 protein [Phaeoacremonium minimum UCRPA7]EOO03909.1 putative inorganic phosphate transporter pho84 protein [Phaeoacremonium minimum UCRPA7]